MWKLLWSCNPHAPHNKWFYPIVAVLYHPGYFRCVLLLCVEHCLHGCLPRLPAPPPCVSLQLLPFAS
jgi:hypothetical protein